LIFSGVVVILGSFSEVAMSVVGVVEAMAVVASRATDVMGVMADVTT
jgi:hypothetical protein